MATKRRQKTKKTVQKTPPETSVYELEFLQGLGPCVSKELRGFKHAKVLSEGHAAIQVTYSGRVQELFALRRAVALYSVTSFNVPRPKALLGDRHFRCLLNAVERVIALHPKGTFSGFRFGAAGSDSSVFQRLAEEISKVIRLPFNPGEGDLLLRVRRTGEAWEVLTRLTPRPLSARPWRVCNLAGGLNATLAVVMNDLVRLGPGERYLNAMCGSGTLLVEQGLSASKGNLVGCDVSQEALACARENLQRAGLTDRVELLRADATELPFEGSSFGVITADVPWGDAVGAHDENARLYPAFLKEAARIAAPHARCAVLTHDIKLFENVLRNQGTWQVHKKLKVAHSGHHPRLYLLRAVES